MMVRLWRRETPAQQRERQFNLLAMEIELGLERPGYPNDMPPPLIRHVTPLSYPKPMPVVLYDFSMRGIAPAYILAIVGGHQKEGVIIVEGTPDSLTNRDCTMTSPMLPVADSVSWLFPVRMLAIRSCDTHMLTGGYVAFYGVTTDGEW